MPYQNEGHIFAVISKRRSYIISKWKSLWEHTPPFLCLFAFRTAGRDLSTVRSTEGLLFTNPGSAAKISLAEERRMTDKTSSLRESLFSRLYGVWYDLNALFVSYQIADSRNTPSGVNRLNCKKSGASYQNENHQYQSDGTGGHSYPVCKWVSFSLFFHPTILKCPCYNGAGYSPPSPFLSHFVL